MQNHTGLREAVHTHSLRLFFLALNSSVVAVLLCDSSLLYLFLLFSLLTAAQCTFNGFHSLDSIPWATATPYFDLVS